MKLTRIITLSLAAAMIACSLASCKPKEKEKTPEVSEDGKTIIWEGEKALVKEAYSPKMNDDGTVDRTAVWTGDPDFKPGKYWGNRPKSPFRDGEGEQFTYGLWCWSTDLFMPNCADNEAAMDMNMVLDQCVSNKVNEIYLSMLSKVQTADNIDKVGYDGQKYTEMELRGFIKKCSEYGIKVYALEGEGGEAALKWFAPGAPRTKRMVQTIAAINENAKSDDEKIAGLHLDLEAPLNASGIAETKKRYQDAADFFTTTAKYCKDVGIKLQFDINAWTQETSMVTIDGKEIPYLDHLTKVLDNLTLMAYRNTAAQQWTQGTNANGSSEVKFGAKNGCNILTGAELSLVYQMSKGERFITYDQKGSKHYVDEMAKLRDTLLDYKKTSADPGAKDARLGAAIHHSTSFWLLMSKAGDGPADFNKWQIDSKRWPWPPEK
ncbi:MAG: hypothetical protein RR497_03040 [Oscillospiraceae bacterium]